MPANTSELIVATVDGRSITLKQLERPLIESHGLNMLINLAQLEIAKKTAEEMKLSVTQQDVDRELEMTLDRMFSDARKEDYDQLLEQFLTRQRLTHAEFEVLMRTNTYLRKIAGPLITGKITDEAVQQAFLAWYGETVVVEHIQCSNIQEINEAKRRLAAGEKFEDVAIAMSRNPRTAPLGGEMPSFSRATTGLPQTFKDAAFAIKVGEVSDPVMAENAYHLLKLKDRIPPKTQKLEDVKDSVRQRLEEQLQQVQINQLRQEISQRVINTLDISDPELKRQFEQKIAQSRGEIQDVQKVRERIARDREKAATQPTTNAANATLPAGEPPATATSPATAPATNHTH